MRALTGAREMVCLSLLGNHSLLDNPCGIAHRRLIPLGPTGTCLLQPISQELRLRTRLLADLVGCWLSRSPVGLRESRPALDPSRAPEARAGHTRDSGSESCESACLRLATPHRDCPPHTTEWWARPTALNGGSGEQTAAGQSLLEGTREEQTRREREAERSDRSCSGFMFTRVRLSRRGLVFWRVLVRQGTRCTITLTFARSDETKQVCTVSVYNPC